MPLELATVSDDEAVAFDGLEVVRLGDLKPDSSYDMRGLVAHTLRRPPGERLATLATVNDTHFGEVVCGHKEGSGLGPELRAEPGEPPYAEVMSNAAALEIAACHPDLVVAKGDVTNSGQPEQWDAFTRCYEARFGDRLVTTLGNHDVAGLNPPEELAPPVARKHRHADFDRQPAAAALAPRNVPPVRSVSVAGVVLAIVDTTVPGHTRGHLNADQLEWLDELATTADRPVLVLGHHHVRVGRRAPWEVKGLDKPTSEGLFQLVRRRPAIVAYLAGHTHRNRVLRIQTTGDFPWVEVASVKDFPGSWAEYRVFEGGILQVHRRIADPAALRWSEKCRALFGGFYPGYALGRLDERCFPIWPRWH
jgi:3',5'-cyclic AMP phosphodiesterase CpdA